MANEFQDVVDQLNKLDNVGMRRIQRKALKRVGEIVTLVAKNDCPVKTDAGGLLKEGELRESIKPRVYIPTDQKVLDGSFPRVVVGPSTDVAKTVERFVVDGHMGPRPKGIAQADRARHDRETGNKWIPANPFMDRAFDECQEAAQDAYMESVTEDINEILP